ncbi:type VI secretion system lipoprotein TssJ [Pseudomonas sp. G.S.17]|uniref:type VI secretion system lipoprotein TssJ n=1 Tax=Pseudomonas sp. G.S.17 TaxID=3137451 RepID=UPI00311CAEEE
MSRTVFNSVALLALGALLGGCGLTQKVTESTASMTKAVFYKQVKNLHLDFSGRSSANTDETDMTVLSVPTLVRVYQLRDNKAVERADYDKLVSNDDNALVGDVLDKRAVVVKPEEGAQLNVPMNEDAQFVVVVALFREPDTKLNAWRLTLTRDDLDPDRARVIELRDSQLTLRPLAKE